jgi:hypothetical protein
MKNIKSREVLPGRVELFHNRFIKIIGFPLPLFYFSSLAYNKKIVLDLLQANHEVHCV